MSKDKVSSALRARGRASSPLCFLCFPGFSCLSHPHCTALLCRQVGAALRSSASQLGLRAPGPQGGTPQTYPSPGPRVVLRERPVEAKVLRVEPGQLPSPTAVACGAEHVPGGGVGSRCGCSPQVAQAASLADWDSTCPWLCLLPPRILLGSRVEPTQPGPELSEPLLVKVPTAGFPTATETRLRLSQAGLGARGG